MEEPLIFDDEDLQSSQSSPTIEYDEDDLYSVASSDPGEIAEQRWRRYVDYLTRLSVLPAATLSSTYNSRASGTQ